MGNVGTIQGTVLTGNACFKKPSHLAIALFKGPPSGPFEKQLSKLITPLRSIIVRIPYKRRHTRRNVILVKRSRYSINVFESAGAAGNNGEQMTSVIVNRDSCFLGFLYPEQDRRFLLHA